MFATLSSLSLLSRSTRARLIATGNFLVFLHVVGFFYTFRNDNSFEKKTHIGYRINNNRSPIYISRTNVCQPVLVYVQCC